MISRYPTLNFSLLSNDNAFLNHIGVNINPFDQRTLLARFRCGDRDGPSVFVQKPIFNTAALFGLLGDERMDNVSSSDDEVSLMVTRRDTNAFTIHSIIVTYNGHNAAPKTVSISTPTVPRALSPKFAVYSVSNEDTNPRRVWDEELGRPACPDPTQLDRLRTSGALKRSQITDLNTDKLEVELASMSVKLVHVCFDKSLGSHSPDQPTRVRFLREGNSSLTLTWRYPSGADCLRGKSTCACV